MGVRKRPRRGPSRCQHPDRTPSTRRPNQIPLSRVLPKIGFTWPRVGSLLDLSHRHRIQLEEAFNATYGKAILALADVEMAAVFLRATEIDASPLDTRPELFWVKVKGSFRGTGSFVAHPILKADTLLSFVTFAIEARENNRKNNPNAERHLTKAVDTFVNMFAHEPDSEWGNAYFGPRRKWHRLPTQNMQPKKKKKKQFEAEGEKMAVEEHEAEERDSNENLESLDEKMAAVTEQLKLVDEKIAAVTAREEAVRVREEAMAMREGAMTAKEEPVAVREELVTAREEVVIVKEEPED